MMINMRNIYLKLLKNDYEEKRDRDVMLIQQQLHYQCYCRMK
jgi:hypothetical protein